MDDRTLDAVILGLAPPWDVVRVELDDTAKAVHVWLEERPVTTFACPECGALSPVYDHVERSWRHLDTCQYETRLHARMPRVACSAHGVKTVIVPWATRTLDSPSSLNASRLRGARKRRRPRSPAASASPGKKPTGSSSEPCAGGSPMRRQQLLAVGRRD